MKAQQHILVVDDDTRIAASIRRALIYEGYTVDVAHNGSDAMARAIERKPNTVILDLLLPDIDGIELCRRLREDGDVPILMLTARDATRERVRGLDAGADDYLVKPFAYEELLARVRALLRRHAPAAAHLLRYADVIMDLAAHETRRADCPIDLTPLEFKLLHEFLLHPRQVLTRDQLLAAVWGFDAEATSNLVDVYMGYLRSKLEANGAPRLIKTVRGVGYVIRED